MNKRAKATLRFLPPLIWMGFIFYLSSRQKIAVSSHYWISFFIFKSLHIIEYGILFLLWYWALGENKKGVRIAAWLAIIYGLSDEIHQGFVPTREGRVRDILIDALGVWLFYRYLLPLWPKKTVVKKDKNN